MHTFRRLSITTPLGPMVAIASDSVLVALEFVKPDRDDRLEARRRRWFPPHLLEDGANAITERAAEWLDGYFAGRSADSRDLPLAMYGSDFEQRVWRALLQISPGETSSYGAIARALSVHNGARAVGLANGANPLAIVVPCHRVIGSTGALTGYGGGLDRKRWLLDHERRWSRSASLF